VKEKWVSLCVGGGGGRACRGVGCRRVGGGKEKKEGGGTGEGGTRGNKKKKTLSSTPSRIQGGRKRIGGRMITPKQARGHRQAGNFKKRRGGRAPNMGGSTSGEEKGVNWGSAGTQLSSGVEGGT